MAGAYRQSMRDRTDRSVEATHAYLELARELGSIAPDVTNPFAPTWREIEVPADVPQGLRDARVDLKRTITRTISLGFPRKHDESARHP